MVVGDGVGDGLQQHGLTGLGLRHDQGALAFADGRKEVHDAGGEVVVAVSRQTELLAWEEGRHEFELHAVADVFGRQPVDFVHADQREILLALLRRTDRSVHGVTGLESEKFDLRRRNVDVVGRVQVVVVRRTQESVTVGHDLQHALAFDLSGEVVLGNHLLLVRTGCGSLFRLTCLSGFLLLCLLLILLGLAAAPLGFRLSGCFLHGLRRRFVLRAIRRELQFGGHFRSQRRLRLHRCGVLRLGHARPASPRFRARRRNCRCHRFRFRRRRLGRFRSRFCHGCFRGGCFRGGSGRSFRRGCFLLSSSLAFILCGSLLHGVSGDLFNQFALLYHDVFDAESFGDFAQFGETFPFERFQILHIFLFQSDFFENPGGRRAYWNSPAKIVHYFEIQNKKLLFTSFRPTFSP